MKIKIKRLIAAYIDMVIAATISFTLTNIITLGNFNISSPIFLKILSMILYLTFLIIFIIKKDCLKKGSIGKRILKIKIVNELNEPITDKQILTKRNLETLFAFYLYPIYIIISNESVGDEKFKTKIIDTK